jgi:fimbrial chaperone protein
MTFVLSLRRAAVTFFASMSVLCGMANYAQAMTVQPVIVDLVPGGRQSTALISVENTGTEPLPVELRVAEAKLDVTGVSVSDVPSEDLIIFPPQAIIPAGGTQSFRVQYVGDPALAKSRHYYITVAQLPVQLPEGTSAIQIVYNFNVIVSVGAAGQRAQISVVSADIAKNDADKPVVAFTVNNAGNNYDYLINGRLRFVQKNAAGTEIFRKTMNGQEIQQAIGFGLVGPEVTRRIVTSIELPSSEGSLNVEFTADRRR